MADVATTRSAVILNPPYRVESTWAALPIQLELSAEYKAWRIQACMEYTDREGATQRALAPLLL